MITIINITICGMLQAIGLNVEYRGIRVLEQISFTVPMGSLTAVIGPNGAGKSSLFKAMLGLTAITGGETLYCDRPLNQQLSRVAYVPQRSQIDWDYPVTVKDVVLMARTVATGWGRSPSRKSQNLVTEALHKVGMWEHRHCRIGELSGGQQQRVFLARSLASQAELLFFDEPFNGIDKQTETAIFNVFGELRDLGKIILVISHDLGQSLQNYDQILMLNRRLIAQGSHHHVLNASNLNRCYGHDLSFFVTG